MTNIPELRQAAEAIRAGVDSIDVAQLLNEAADTIEDLCKQIDGTVRVAANALKRVKELESQ